MQEKLQFLQTLNITNSDDLETFSVLLSAYGKYAERYQNRFNRNKYFSFLEIYSNKKALDLSRCAYFCEECKRNKVFNNDKNRIVQFFSKCINIKMPFEFLWELLLGNILSILSTGSRKDPHILKCISNFFHITLDNQSKLSSNFFIEYKIRLGISFFLLIDLINGAEDNFDSCRDESEICTLLGVDQLTDFLNLDINDDKTERLYGITAQRLIILYSLCCNVRAICSKTHNNLHVENCKQLIKSLYKSVYENEQMHFTHYNSILLILDKIIANDELLKNETYCEALRKIIWFTCKYHLLFWDNFEILSENISDLDNIIFTIKNFWREDFDFRQKNEFLNYIDHLIKLYSVYCHTVLKIDKRFKIDHYIKSIANSDGVLYATKPFYREHAVHSIDVAMMGEALLAQLIPSQDNISLIEYCGSLLGCEQDDTLRYWHLAASYHDIAYPIDLFTSIYNQMKYLDTKSFKNLKETISDSFASKLTNIYESYKELHNPIPQGIDHGMLSSIFFFEVIESIVNEDFQSTLTPDNEAKKNTLQYFMHSVSSISYHSNKKLNFNAKECIIGALLVLIDEIQEWGRARLYPEDLSIAALMNARSLISKKPRIIKLSDYINLTIKDECWIFDIKYLSDESSGGNIVPIDILFSKVENLQRINWNSIFPIVMKLTFHKNNKFSEANIYRLFQETKDISISEPIASVSNDFSEQRNYPICQSEDSYKEIFVVNLDMLPSIGTSRFLKIPFPRVRYDYYRYREEFLGKL